MKSVLIAGQPYLVDTTRLAIIDVRDFDNILYADEMISYGKQYSFTIDKNTKMPVQHGKENESNKYVKVFIEQFLKLDPDGMRTRYSIPKNEPLPEYDNQLETGLQAFDNRLMAGKMPLVEIVNKKYMVNGRKQYLVNDDQLPKGGPIELVGMDQLILLPDAMRLFYDARKKRILTTDEQLKPAEKDLWIVEIPDFNRMDPLGQALRTTTVEELMKPQWRQIPYQENHKALSMPVKNIEATKKELMSPNLFRTFLLNKNKEAKRKTPRIS